MLRLPRPTSPRDPLTLILALVLVATSATAAQPASAAAPAPATDSQNVAVAFLEPRTEIDVDVVTGAVAAGGYGKPFDEPPQEEVGLAGFVDPYRHALFTYRSGGIPGVPEANRSLGAQVPSPATPSWGPPRLQSNGPAADRLVLADGRYADIGQDPSGRTTRVRWPLADGSWITSVIAYGPSRTTVRLPFGVTRSYAYAADGRVVRVLASGAAKHARHDTVDGLLDTPQTTRLHSKRLRPLSRAEDEIDKAAHGTLANVYQDEPANGGYTVFGVNSLAAARRLNRKIARLGLLDVAEAIPERHSFIQFKRESDRLGPLFKILGECVVSTGIRFGAGIDVDVARTIAAPEVESLDRFLARTDDWVFVYYGAQTECSTPV